MPLLIAEGALEPFLMRSVFQLRTSFQAGQSLLTATKELNAKIMAEPDVTKVMDFGDVYAITSKLTAFEAVLGAELALMPLYVVQPKAGYDTPTLIESGAVCFPADLPTKVPAAVFDIQQGTRCIAFELFTGAGFHLHRANEAILRRYWEIVTDGAAPPKSGNMGDFLNEMEQKKFGDEKVRAALKDLKNLHRNPLIHPEHTIADAHEAIALMNSIHVVMVHMLKEIPVVAPASEPQAGSLPAPNSQGERA
ncbi:MAG TPA: hypothetical protein VNR39_09385 [Pseudolabrys sp.]|nr:hypothetical protein [Pseudolabrys sp.]